MKHVLSRNLALIGLALCVMLGSCGDRGFLPPAETIKRTASAQASNVTVPLHSVHEPADGDIRVIGEAVNPLAVPYRQNMSVLDVIFATKGMTKFAAGNRAFILRGTVGRQTKISVRLSDLVKDGDVSQNVMMQPGDTLVIPETFF